MPIARAAAPRPAINEDASIFARRYATTTSIQAVKRVQTQSSSHTNRSL